MIGKKSRSNVFLYGSRCSNPFIVYLYFIMVVTVAVCIMLNVIVAFFVETFVTQLSLVDVEEKLEDAGGTSSIRTLQSEISTRITPITRSWIFDSNDLKKEIVKSNCPISGKIIDFDLIHKEGFDDIIGKVNNDYKQVEDFARSLSHSIEAINSLTPGWNENFGHMLCCRHNKNRFKSKNFCDLVKIYLPLDDDLTSLIKGIEENLSPASGDKLTNPSQHIIRCLSNPNDSSKILQINGTLLPLQNKAIIFLTAVVKEFKS